MRIKNKRAVPVAHRSEPKKRGIKLQAPFSLGGFRLMALVAVLVLVAFMIYTPLNTYLQQKAEMKRVAASISQKEAEKEQLINDIERYNDEAYVREQARLRLGLIEQGETAFRLVDPALNDPNDADADAKANAEKDQPWYRTMWKSIATPPAESEPAEQTDMHLPIAPAP
ncbi:septum formation initiator family protein [Corynebacterium gerontici]|nr:septum formation initiator family protein [Corynebacterium gerontici]